MTEWPFPQAPCPPYFDAAHSGWIFTRYADVVSILHDTRFVPAAPEAGGEVRVHADRSYDTGTLTEKLDAAIPPSIAFLKEELAKADHRDLAPTFRSLCLQAACTITGLTNSSLLSRLAEDTFRAAAYPYDQSLQPARANAITELAGLLAGDPLRVQAFVALATSLPALLTGALYLLVENREELTRLCANPESAACATEECLRLCGPAAIQFRRAAARAGEIQRGDLILLVVRTANRDPLVFPAPERFDVTRHPNPHLAFGRGAHVCAGAQMIRQFTRAVLGAVAPQLTRLKLSSPPEWRGAAIRFLESLELETGLL